MKRRTHRSGVPLLLGAMSVAALVPTACATSGREVSEGIRYYPASEDEPERWQGSWQDVPLLVVMAGSASEGIRGPRAFAVRDALWDQLPNRRDLWQVVVSGEARGDTLGEVLWLPPTAMRRECVGYDIIPGDSIRPQTTVCNRTESSSRTSWNPQALQRSVAEAGGNAVLLYREEYAGTFRGLRGYVLRCPEGESGPVCS